MLLGGGLAPAQGTARPPQAPHPAWSVPPPPVPQATARPPLPASPPQAGAVRPTAWQMPPADTGGAGIDYQIQTEPPGLDRLSRIETEADLFERIRQENLARGERITFPDEPVLSTDTYLGRNWPRTDMLVAPYYVCHGRLLFQQKNAERYGWDLGPFHPLLSGLVFFGDVVALPYRLATNPCCCYDCSAGYCLPGDPVPFLLYPPRNSLTGLLAEGATIAALLAIFP